MQKPFCTLIYEKPLILLHQKLYICLYKQANWNLPKL